MSELLRRFRKYWYNNEPGLFASDRLSITRKQIQVHGGPSPSFNDCPTCQSAEWLSRIHQQNLFQDHSCPTSVKQDCRALCQKQGDDLWTIYHQNFWYAKGCNPELDAPRACLFLDYGRMHTRYWTPNCDAWMNDLRRSLAQIGTLETKQAGQDIDWSQYDWLWMNAAGYRFRERPPLPIVMFACDTNHGNIQELLDLEPDILWTPYPSAWRDNFHVADRTKITFTGCKAVSSFFTRPNLGDKSYDLLVIGAVSHNIYAPRKKLVAQVKPLADEHVVGFNQRFGWFCDHHPGPVQYTAGNDTVNYLNKWSEFLSSARYVIFGPTAGVAQEYMTIKVYECLGSGAIPILPEVKDFALLGIEPMVHYIPLSQAWQNNARLEELLNSYDKYKHIAENAVRWHQENVDRMLFTDFENLIHELLGQRYPKRLL